MNWNNHLNLAGKHAPFSASGYHWLGYDVEKMLSVYRNSKKKEEGTILHDLASQLIRNKVKVANEPKAFNMFVNDSIDDKMTSEQVLYFSDYFFGTADAIRFNKRKKELYIYDLKTGRTKPSFKQLNIYAALFCLEYNVNPIKLYIETRLYQFSGCEVNIPDPEEILCIMDLIREFNDALVYENS